MYILQGELSVEISFQLCIYVPMAAKSECISSKRLYHFNK